MRPNSESIPGEALDRDNQPESISGCRNGSNPGNIQGLVEGIPVSLPFLLAALYEKLINPMEKIENPLRVRFSILFGRGAFTGSTAFSTITNNFCAMPFVRYIVRGPISGDRVVHNFASKTLPLVSGARVSSASP